MSDDDDTIAQPFDQTNGVVQGLEGESDGTRSGDDYSAGKRADEDPTVEDDEPEPDREGVADLRDPNP